MARKPVKHVMLDLETLSLASNAAVIQIGMVAGCGNSEAFSTFEISISPEQYRNKLPVFDVDAATIAWHHKTNEENFQKCQASEVKVREAANAVREFIEEQKEGGTYQIWLWACGTDFDIAVLNNFFKVAGVKPNWAYGNVRDYRTLREMHPEVPKNYKNNHSALSDAVNQFGHLMEILGRMQKHGGYCG